MRDGIPQTAVLPLNTWMRLCALAAMAGIAFVLTIFSLPFFEWRMHFFQVGIFLAAFVFGPWAGAAVGAVSSSYVALFVIHNPWIIGGNLLLGFFAGYFFPKQGATKSMMWAYTIQIPYLVVTDFFFGATPFSILTGVLITLFATGLLCACVAGKLAPTLSSRL